MASRDCPESSGPPAKRSKKALSLPKPDFSDLENQPESTDHEETRFVSPLKSLEDYQQGFVPKNTEVNTQ